MNLSASPATAPFDPDAGTAPAPLDSLLSSPDRATPLVLLVAGADARRTRWADGAAAALARIAAEYRGSILLADASLAEPRLHELLDGPNTEGLADVFLFGASLESVARATEDGAVRLVPAGIYAGSPARVLTDPAWERIAARLARDGETMLVYVPKDAPGLEELARLAGHAVALGGSEEEAGAVAAALPSACEVEAALYPARTGAAATAAAIASEPESEPARVEPVPADPVNEEDELDEPGFVRQQEPKRRRRVSPVLWVALLVLLIAGAWAALQYFGSPAETVEAVRRAVPGGFIGPNAGSETVAEANGAAGTASGSPVESPLPYSVALASYEDIGTALERVAALRDQESELGFYVVPVLIDSVLYYRVLAGPVADSAAAERVVDRLVAGGYVERQPGAIRATPLAFDLGDFGTRAAADARADTLRSKGVPTYIVEVPYTAGPPRFHIYAGAYEGPAAAMIMANFLRKSGITDYELLERIGRPAG